MINPDFVGTLQPMTAPNKLLKIDIPLTKVNWPKLMSIKYNGVRALALGGEWIGRSGKPLNISFDVAEKFQPILDYAKKNRLVLDGELNANSHNTVGETVSILAGKIPLPTDFYFKCFYEIPYPVWNNRQETAMEHLIATELNLAKYMPVKQELITCAGKFESIIQNYQYVNIEGFMLLHPRAKYLHKRCTINEQVLLKFKFYSDPEDGQIVNITARKERKEGVEGTTNAFGYKEQVYTQDSFNETDIAGCLKVRLETGEEIHTPFPIGWTLEMRQQAYHHFGTGSMHDLKNKWICFRRLSCENRNKPIGIKKVEIRDDK